MSRTHRLLGHIWCLHDGDAATVPLLAVPRGADDEPECVRPIVTPGNLPSEIVELWDAQRIGASTLRSFDSLMPGSKDAPLLARFAEAELIASLLMGRLPRVQEVAAIAAHCSSTCPLKLPVDDAASTVWTADVESPLQSVFDEMAPHFPEWHGLADRCRALADQGGIRTHRRRVVTFDADQSYRLDARAPEETAAVWLVFDEAMAGAVGDAAP